jgi:hypothetical protein
MMDAVEHTPTYNAPKLLFENAPVEFLFCTSSVPDDIISYWFLYLSLKEVHQLLSVSKRWQDLLFDEISIRHSKIAGNREVYTWTEDILKGTEHRRHELSITVDELPPIGNEVLKQDAFDRFFWLLKHDTKNITQQTTTYDKYVLLKSIFATSDYIYDASTNENHAWVATTPFVNNQWLISITKQGIKLVHPMRKPGKH